ncbi:MAG: SDR family NAD(P)-dependent oxidoreductase [Steroidobacteraceae bacterium]|jgi:NAD(P)-dependent dehydrogenase (short-subunit alcohol dehydrogenase family)|nr:SDR family NAD(P)-dependent oxidoreductase [Steroidobacteraceae bacterium]
MSDRIILITGAAGGLGRAVTASVQARSWTPVCVGRDPARLEAAFGPGGPARIVAEVGTADGAKAAVAECVRAHGVPDGLVNCAGEVLIAPLHRTAEAQYRACLAANLDTAFFALGAWLDALRAQPVAGASAVLVSSVAARIGIQNHEAVAAAKGAVEALVRSAAATYAPLGVRVNGVAPGLMDTPATAGFLKTEAGRKSMAAQYPLGRYGSADDVAGAIAWLLSDEAAWATGQVLGVDGGFTAVRPLVRGA